jgi:ferredoxin--NADP+ reductase
MNPHQVVTPVTIAFSRQVSRGIILLGFPRDFRFSAGQVIGVSLSQDGPRRLYSICSGEQEDMVQILYNVIEAGYLTPLLSRLGPGDTLWITRPRGEFTCKAGPAVWIATGTGIAPFYSMLRSGVTKEILLIHGNRYLEQFYFSQEVISRLGSNYIRCCSAESQEGFYHGRVTGYLSEHPLPGTGLMYYLCGSAEMVVETRDILIAKGIPFGQIISEIYF